MGQMEERALGAYDLAGFREYLVREEKSRITIEKYIRDVKGFLNHIGDQELVKETVLNYKEYLLNGSYAARSVNSMLASVNKFLEYLDRAECKVKSVRTQRQIYCTEEKELTREEYRRLLEAAGRKPRLKLLLQTICSTGIRVSELQYFTVEAVRRGEINVRCKGKIRTILIPGKLKKQLLDYIRLQEIGEGAIFITRNGNPLDRSYIWAQMKKLCAAAGIHADKVFPHNLRKLFARTYYNMEKDIAKLADILGHGSIETTRIYIMTTGGEHLKQMERMELVL